MIIYPTIGQIKEKLNDNVVRTICGEEQINENGTLLTQTETFLPSGNQNERTPALPNGHEQRVFLNSTNIFCPVCSTTLMKPCTGWLVLIDEEAEQIEKNMNYLNQVKLSNLQSKAHWFVDDMFKFENMGFTRLNHQNATTHSSEINKDIAQENAEVGTEEQIVSAINGTKQQQQLSHRYLVCAECNFGPLGWQHPETKHNFVHVFFPATQDGLTDQ